MKNNKQHVICEKILHRFFFISACLLILSTLATLFPIVSRGGQTVEAVGETQGSSLTLNVDSNIASADLKPLDINGTFVKSSNINFSIDTNHYSGYKLFINASDNDGYLSSDNYNINSIISSLNEGQFNTAQNNNLWGYSYNNGDYMPSPTTTATMLDNTADASTNDYILAFGARINYEVPTGTYSKSLTLSAVTNPISYRINYVENTSYEVSGMPEVEYGATTATTTQISKNIPTRSDGYIFGGWCTEYATNESSTDVCTGQFFAAGEEYQLNQTTINSLDLFAVWINDSMQDFTINNCKNYTDTAAVLRDKRDNKKYSVRYINGGCWMTQNLSFDLVTGMTLHATSTNLRGLDSYTTTMGTVNDLTSGNSYTEASFNAPTEDDLAATNLTAEQNGYWYNYCAASAGQICTGSSTDEATIDICPANWRMPDSTELRLIATNGGWKETYVEAFSPVAAGRWYNGSLEYDTEEQQKIGGSWWSSTIYSADDGEARRYLKYAPSLGLVSYGINKRYGFSIRCILDETATAMTMQEYTEDACSSGALYFDEKLLDERDGKDYTVRYIADSCWMTQNLDFVPTGDNANLDPTTTNVSSPKTLAATSSKQSSSTDAYYYTPTESELKSESLSLTTKEEGTLYNYCAASAGEICSENNKNNATEDLCPAGWRLPTDSEYSTIDGMILAFSPVYSGTFSDGSFGFVDYGSWWSSTVENPIDNVYVRTILGYSSNFLHTITGIEPQIGFSVRCIRQ